VAVEILSWFNSLCRFTQREARDVIAAALDVQLLIWVISDSQQFPRDRGQTSGTAGTHRQVTTID
jgi:hypothetical protein